MATRLYFDSSGSPAVSPGFDAGWEDTVDATRLPLSGATGSAFATTQYRDNDNKDEDHLIHQWVSPPIAGAVSFAASNTLKVQMRCLELNAANNLELTVGVRIVSNDGATVRGTIIAVTRDGNEMATTLTNRQFTATTSAVSAQDGDRIVVEIGCGGDPTGGNNHDADIRIGAGSGTDLPEDDTTTADQNGWIEFVETFGFQALSSEVTQAASIRLLQNGEKTQAASFRVQQNGEATQAASIRVQQNGEAAQPASIQVALRGESVQDASVRIAGRGVGTLAASYRVKSAGEVTQPGSVRIAIPTEIVFKLGALAEPGVDTDHELSYVIGKDAAAGEVMDAIVQLEKPDGTVVHRWDHAALDETENSFTQAVPSASIAALAASDYANGLLVAFREVPDGSGAARRFRVYWLELCLPEADALAGQVTQPVSMRVLQNGVVTENASFRVRQNGEATQPASIQVALRGEVTQPASIQVALRGEVTQPASIRVRQNGEATQAASINISGVFLGEVTMDASVRIRQNGESTQPASFRLEQNGESTQAASYQAAQRGEIAQAASYRVAARGLSTQAASVLYAARGTLTQDASANIAQRGLSTIPASIRYAGRGVLTQPSSAHFAQRGVATQAASIDIFSGPIVRGHLVATLLVRPTLDSDLEIVPLLGGEVEVRTSLEGDVAVEPD